MGLMEFMVKELVVGLHSTYKNKLKQSKKSAQKDNHLNPQQKCKHQRRKSGNIQNITCRICLSNEFKNNDPFICPCQCTGSLKYVHFKCLQKWQEKQVTFKHRNTISIYTHQQFHCEICKSLYSTKIKYQDQIIEFLNIERPRRDYILLKNLPNANSNLQYYVIIDMSENNAFTIGRKNICSIQVNENTVSRIHSKIHIRNKVAYLTDMKSKFGTQVLIQDNEEFPLHLKEFNLINEEFLLSFTVNKQKKKSHQKISKNQIMCTNFYDGNESDEMDVSGLQSEEFIYEYENEIIQKQQEKQIHLDVSENPKNVIHQQITECINENIQVEPEQQNQPRNASNQVIQNVRQTLGSISSLENNEELQQQERELENQLNLMQCTNTIQSIPEEDYPNIIIQQNSILDVEDHQIELS